jgi:hypothetical protein
VSSGRRNRHDPVNVLTSWCISLLTWRFSAQDPGLKSRFESCTTAALLILASCVATPGFAVEVGTGYQTTAPTGTDIANWDTGWGQSGITGWNYVGEINGGASATYLGNGWVLTAGHAGSGDFNLDGNTYTEIAGSAQTIGTADLSLFQIDTTSTSGTQLSLPALALSTGDPVAFNGTRGSQVVIIGYGGSTPNGGESWGVNTVTQINQSVALGSSYVSNDFLTILGTTTIGDRSVTNDAQLVAGDSGGGDFIRNSATGLWELAGINEAVGTTSQGQQLSAFVQLDSYAPQIEAAMSPVPLPASAWLMLGGLGGLGLVLRGRRSVDSDVRVRV